MSVVPRLSRRDILKLIALAPAALAVRPLISLLDREPDANTPHVLVFVFDAWSAYHLKLHGYPRDTMPNLTRFAERCHVYHNHFSNGSFTVPGTASLLTGLHPWNHRAVQLTTGGVTREHRDDNLFFSLAASHSTAGYAQNPYANIFLYQFEKSLDSHVPEDQFNLERRMVSSLPLFKNDNQMAYASFENNILRNGKGSSGSLYLGMISRLAGLVHYRDLRNTYLREYPTGLPVASGAFSLDDLTDGLINTIREFELPTLAYFHIYPPHEPYAPKRDFVDLFNDGWAPVEKPIHPLSLAKRSLDDLLINRRRYDQYLAAWDAQFALVLEYLESSGLLDKSIVVVTSDHGELFERGEIGHLTYLLSSPVVQVPLLISLPGQSERKDIHSFTSGVDVLPTIAHLAGVDAPTWGDGRLLPGLGGEDDPDRSIYSIDAKTASSFSSFEQYSVSIMKQGHRLIYYKYSYYTGFEFYNLAEDREELKDLYPSKPALATQMQDELLQTIAEFNHPYEKS
jgi:arylsulfatase A-like enzyme